MDTTGAQGVGNRKLPKGCCEIVSDKFNFDDSVQLESAQESNFTGFVRPIGGMEAGSPYTFKLESMADSFLQMNSLYFYVKCKVVDESGDDLTDTSKVGLVNAFGLSFFNNIQVHLNEFQIGAGTDIDIAYKNYIETMLSYETEARTTHLRTSIFELDSMDHLEKFDPTTADNKPFKIRAKKIAKSKEFDFTAPLCADLLRADNHLAPGNSLLIKAIKNNDSFLLKSETLNAGFKILVRDIRLYYNRIRLDPTLTPKILGGVQKYLCAKTVVKRFILPSGLTTYNAEIFNGPLPRTIVLAQVLTSAANGNYSKNPFNIRHFDVNRVSLRINGQSLPSDGYTPDFENNLYAREYTELFVNTGTWRSDRGASVSFDRFKKGSTFFVWDTTNDRCNSMHLHPTKSGLVELEMNWSKALPSPITLIVYAAYNQRITISGLKEPALEEII